MSKPTPSKPCLPYHAAIALMTMCATMSVTIIVANLAAMKIWNFCGIPVDGGIIMFPITYILGDLLVEIYGRRTANLVTTWSLVLGFGTCLALQIVAQLPNYANVDDTGFTVVASLANRIYLASLISFWCSQRVNNLAFVKIRDHAHGVSTQRFWFRALASSAIAHLVDSGLFEIAAFYGRLPFQDFISQIIFAYFAGILLELVLLPLTNFLAARLIRKLNWQNGAALY